MRPVVILISGALSDPAALFAPLCRTLASFADTCPLSWSVASHPDPAAGYQLDDELRLVESAVERAGGPRVHLLGTSGGCTGALLFALAHPGMVASLTLAEPGWLGGMAWWDGERDLAAEFARLAGLPDRALLSSFAALLTGGQPRSEESGTGSETVSRRAAELRAVFRTWWRHRLDLTALSDLGAAVYLPVGELSPVRSHAAARYLADVIPHAETEIIPGHGHLNLMRAPELIQGVQRAMTRADARAASPRPAHPRIAPLPARERTGLAAELLAATPLPAANIFTTLVRAPGLFRAWAPLGKELLDGRLPARDRELLILRTAWNCRAEYEWAQHAVAGRGAGLADDEILRVTAEGTDGWPRWEAALLRAADELHTDTSMGDPTWAELATRYDTGQLIEVPMLVGQYHMVAMTLNSIGVQLDPELSGFPSTVTAV
jgi:4-carboxymuconolactone decarboxylase